MQRTLQRQIGILDSDDFIDFGHILTMCKAMPENSAKYRHIVMNIGVKTDKYARHLENARFLQKG